MATPLAQPDTKSVKDYAEQVSSAFGSQFKDATDRFKRSDLLLRRFMEAVDILLEKGWSQFNAVNEAHNELCVAGALLSSTDPMIARLEYEPPLVGYKKTIDFRATYGTITLYVDVKTIQPRTIDKWDQYEKYKEEGLFPERVKVIHEKEWLGGELWQNSRASRERMLEHAIGLENKISGGNLVAGDTFFILAFCGSGFHWHQDDLEDFVHFYRTGVHWPGDGFAKAEAYYIQDKRLTIRRTISRIACMFRPTFGIHIGHLNWDVKPPRYPNPE